MDGFSSIYERDTCSEYVRVRYGDSGKMMSPLFFSDREQWRSWLERNHGSEKEVWLLFHKKRIGRLGLSMNEAVEEAICYGWIDSILRRLDEDRKSVV
jgi:uncharacterized protein YdeI (YjbR/CyaY-like superfamily)